MHNLFKGLLTTALVLMLAGCGSGSSGGFGRWLKKRWYIPVLAAVVIGVTVADDDDAGEEEDD